MAKHVGRPLPKRQKSANGRKGDVFAVRVTPEERARLQAAANAARPFGSAHPAPLGPWLLAVALRAALAELGGSTARPPRRSRDLADVVESRLRRGRA